MIFVFGGCSIPCILLCARQDFCVFSEVGLKGDAFDKILNRSDDTRTREGKLSCHLA